MRLKDRRARPTILAGVPVEKLEIRLATPGDLRSIKAVFKSHEAGHDWKLARTYYREYFTTPELRASEVVLVGVAGERVAGVIGYLHDRRNAQSVFWLGWFYVHREARGMSVGRRLVERVVAEVRARGGRKLYTDTSSWKFYDRAHRFYREAGFVEEGTLRDYYEDGEHQVIYGLDLTAPRCLAGAE